MIYTSYFANVRNIPKDISLFSIAGKDPDGTHFQKLYCFVPKKDWWWDWKKKFKGREETEESINEYKENYFKQIKISDILDTMKQLDTDKDICLLCYESPKKFCHRHLAAECLRSLGFSCEELSNVKV